MSASEQTNRNYLQTNTNGQVSNNRRNERMLKKEIEKSKKHSSYFSYVGVDRSKEKKKQECLETLWRQYQLKNKELISKKRKTIYQN